MLASLATILDKKPEDLTDEDKKEIFAALEAFKKAVEEVCREHGFAYQAIVNVTKEGIVPILDIIRIKETVETEKEASA